MVWAVHELTLTAATTFKDLRNTMKHAHRFRHFLRFVLGRFPRYLHARVGAATCALLISAGLPAANAAVLSTNGSWASFNVDANLSPFSFRWVDDNSDPLSFTFNIAAGFNGKLTVVDAGFYGDRYNITDGGVLLGSTSLVANGPSSSTTPIQFDYDLALADGNFSRGIFMLGAGAHSISGLMTSSTFDASGPLNASFGGLRLEVSAVSPVPEPSATASLLAGLCLMGFVTLRNQRKN